MRLMNPLYRPHRLRKPHGGVEVGEAQLAYQTRSGLCYAIL